MVEDLDRRPTSADDSPPDRVRASPEEHEDPWVAARPWPEAFVHSVPRSARLSQRCGRDIQFGVAVAPRSRCGLLTDRVSRRGALCHGGWHRRPVGVFHLYVNSPQCAGNPLKVGRVVDLFVPDELGPRAVRGVGKVLRWTFPGAVPPTLGLVGALPEERPAPVSMPEQQHQAGPGPSSEVASRRTTCTCGSSADQRPSSTSRGVSLSRAARGRLNQRRIP